MVAWVGPQCAILIFPYHTNLLFGEHLFFLIVSMIGEVNDDVQLNLSKATALKNPKNVFQDQLSQYF